MEHIADGNTRSPYISLTWSFGIALAYALHTSLDATTSSPPGYVYRIEIPNSLPARSMRLFDPVQEICRLTTTLPDAPPYRHEGTKDFLLGVISTAYSHMLTGYEYDVSTGMISELPRTASRELQALSNALRDAEVLALHSVPSVYVKDRYLVPP